MKRLSDIIIAIAICAAIVLSSMGITYALGAEKAENKENKANKAPATAEEVKELSKDETVYVLADSDGSVKKIIVSDWIKNTLSDKSVSDKSELKNIKNVKGDEKYTLSSDNMTVWDAEGNDIYYEGNIEKELPVGLTVSYSLNGKPISAKKIAGKSGKVKVRFDYENRQYETVEIDGKKEKIYVPFVMLTGMLLDSDSFRNVEVSNGKLLNDGDRTAVIGFALPGLQDNLGIQKEQFSIPDYVEITADVKNFDFGMTVTLATNGIFNLIDTSKLNSIESLLSSADELAGGMKQLLDGSSALYGGLDTLLSKSDELVAGINMLADGAKTLKEGSETLDEGAAKLKAGLGDLSGGLDTLSQNNDSLNGGAKQVFDTLLNTAYTQLNASGITVPALTIENYAEVLSGVITSLDSNNVYNQALSEVTKAVNANRALIEAGVTAAVRDNVATQVIPQATGNQMTKETYDAAVALGQVQQQTVLDIESAIDAQMKTDGIKQTIAQNTDLQIQKTISETMLSDEIKAKLNAAAEGSKSVISLKESLDSYNVFYLGLLTYTSGVSSAADGAKQLSDGASDLGDGISKLRDGATKLYGGILELKNGCPALKSGVSELKNGAMQLNGGLKKLNDEGISKITDLMSGSVSPILTRVKATVDVSKSYRNFSGIADGMNGQVKFIYRTEEITAEKK